MSEKRKPDISVKIKPATGGELVSLAAFWRNEDGRLGGGFDRRVKRVAMLVDDGNGGTQKIDAVRGPDGKWSHYLNCYEDGPASPGAPARAARAAKGAPPADDWSDGGGDDGLPF